MEVAVYYFTFTGNSKRVAEIIGKALNCRIFEIRSFKLPYIIWLLLSFIPLLEIPAKFEKVTKDAIIICFPKWTFNCPPVTYFMRRMNAKKIGLVITYGGFDEKRYAEFYKGMAKKKAKDVEYLLIKKDAIDEEKIVGWLKGFLQF
ncbi:MAG: hypothetical protein QFX40_05590 [Archaeoglobales archaeon]|nr:hypothetical protein [Archaeoglobales archaeon]